MGSRVKVNVGDIIETNDARIHVITDIGEKLTGAELVTDPETGEQHINPPGSGIAGAVRKIGTMALEDLVVELDRAHAYLLGDLGKQNFLRELEERRSRGPVIKPELPPRRPID